MSEVELLINKILVHYFVSKPIMILKYNKLLVQYSPCIHTNLTNIQNVK